MRRKHIKSLICIGAFLLMLLHAVIPHHHSPSNCSETTHQCSHTQHRSDLCDQPVAHHLQCHVNDFWKPTKQYQTTFFALAFTQLFVHFNAFNFIKAPKVIYFIKAYKPPEISFKQLRAPPVCSSLLREKRF